MNDEINKWQLGDPVTTGQSNSFGGILGLSSNHYGMHGVNNYTRKSDNVNHNSGPISSSTIASNVLLSSRNRVPSNRNDDNLRSPSGIENEDDYTKRNNTYHHTPYQNDQNQENRNQHKYTIHTPIAAVSPDSVEDLYMDSRQLPSEYLLGSTEEYNTSHNINVNQIEKYPVRTFGEEERKQHSSTSLLMHNNKSNVVNVYNNPLIENQKNIVTSSIINSKTSKLSNKDIYLRGINNLGLNETSFGNLTDLGLDLSLGELDRVAFGNRYDSVGGVDNYNQKSITSNYRNRGQKSSGGDIGYDTLNMGGIDLESLDYYKTTTDMTKKENSKLNTKTSNTHATSTNKTSLNKVSTIGNKKSMQ